MHEVSLERAIEIARQAAEKIGLDLSDMTFEGDEQNSRWNNYRTRVSTTSEDVRKAESVLRRQSYWAVYGAPKDKPGTLRGGGDLFVFIARDSGKVIEVLRLTESRVI
jgi:UPF0288 family protein (methanogenesis marker protein 3)